MFNLVKSLSFINDALYTYVLIILLLGCGLYLSFKTLNKFHSESEKKTSENNFLTSKRKMMIIEKYL